MTVGQQNPNQIPQVFPLFHILFFVGDHDVRPAVRVQLDRGDAFSVSGATLPEIENRVCFARFFLGDAIVALELLEIRAGENINPSVIVEIHDFVDRLTVLAFEVETVRESLFCPRPFWDSGRPLPSERCGRLPRGSSKSRPG